MAKHNDHWGRDWGHNPAMYLVVDWGVTPPVVVTNTPMLDEKEAHTLADEYQRVHNRHEDHVLVMRIRVLPRTAAKPTDIAPPTVER